MAENVHCLNILRLFFAAFGKEVCACFGGGNNWTCGEIPQKKNGSGPYLSGMPLVVALKSSLYECDACTSERTFPLFIRV